MMIYLNLTGMRNLRAQYLMKPLCLIYWYLFLYLSIKERGRTYERKKFSKCQTDCIIKEDKKGLCAPQQSVWNMCEKSAQTNILILQLSIWVTLKWDEVNYSFMQFLTEHGSFINIYLKKKD